MKSKILILIATLFAICFSSCQKQEESQTPESVAVITVPDSKPELVMTGTRAVTIMATSNWTAVSNASWLTVSPSEGGVGMNEVILHFTENTTGAERKGTVTFTAGNYSEPSVLTQSILTEHK